MPDSIRMMDLAALTRGLEEFRQLDPEHRLQTRRLIAQTAAQHAEEARQDVPESGRTAEPQIRDRRERRGGHRRDAPSSRDDAPDARADSPPESDEGHVLDLLA